MLRELLPDEGAEYEREGIEYVLELPDERDDEADGVVRLTLGLR